MFPFNMTSKMLDLIIVGGLGHVGLPLGLLFADSGLRVGALDLDEKKKNLVRKGVMPFVEHGAEPILQKVLNKNLLIVDDLREISHARGIVVTVGTPVDEYLTPQLFVMSKVAESLLPYLQPQQHVILRSTVYPGTTERLFDLFRSRGRQIHVSFCPERIVQGHAVRELRELPHIISSLTPEGLSFCREIFSKLYPKIVEVGVREAELTKLFANAWRYIGFAAANQFYMMAQDHHADIREIYRALTEDYPRGQDVPRPGFTAGPCLLKDTMQLCSFYSRHSNLGYTAMQINEGLPGYCIEKIRQKYDLKNKKVGLLGMAFKADVDDIRDSLSFKLRKLLGFHGADVLCTDEYILSPEFLPLEQVLHEADLFIVATPHRKYKALVFPENKAVFNIWDLDSCIEL
jgi:UDP-N-acetyl-D-mannosaminuronic acid dehydrogenase